MIKTERTDRKVDNYPYLAQVGDTIILITAKQRCGELVGMVIHSSHPGNNSSHPGNNWRVGYYSDSWNADELRRCNDIVTLQNV